MLASTTDISMSLSVSLFSGELPPANAQTKAVQQTPPSQKAPGWPDDFGMADLVGCSNDLLWSQLGNWDL